jgi:hypothetical protein
MNKAWHSVSSKYGKNISFFPIKFYLLPIEQHLSSLFGKVGENLEKAKEEHVLQILFLGGLILKESRAVLSNTVAFNPVCD